MRKSISKIAPLLVLATAFGLSSCSTPAEEAVTDSYSIRIGIKYDQPGVSYMSESGPTGFDVDVAAYVAMKLGYSPYEVQWVEVNSDNREEMLTNGSVDLVVAAYSITDERRELVDFAGPYLVAGQDILVRANESRIDGSDYLAGLTICSATGSTSTDKISEIYGSYITVVERETYADCVAAVIADAADAVTTEDVVLAGLASTDENFSLVRLVGKPFTEESYGIGLPKGSRQDCETINEALTEMVADGSWERFIYRHTAGTGYDPSAYGNPPEPLPCQ
jgi:glutamate transport system substrate-binding protein